MIIQIYEIQNPGEAGEMISLGVDHIGSVLTGEREIKMPQLRETIFAAAKGGAKTSLIPLINDIDLISSAIDYYRPHIVHFCQSIFGANLQWEPVCGRLMSMQATVKERFPQIDIMRSIPVPPPGAGRDLPVFEAASHFEPLTDYFLVDTIIMEGISVAGQPESGYVGITGRICDWEIAAELVNRSAIPVILAGGLSPENVYDAVRAVRPAGVDSCTLTNAVDEAGALIRFKKDREKVARFVAEARRAEREVESSRFKDKNA
ncbi:MAG: phosphoribosylanthranilate isomerase [Desulfobacterales bacterium]